MFYLVMFLSMIIGMFIYMMDPVPPDMRYDLTARDTEADVMTFLNQHQVAKQFTRIFLARISPYSKATNHEVAICDASGSINSWTKDPSSLTNVCAIALPPAFAGHIVKNELEVYGDISETAADISTNYYTDTYLRPKKTDAEGHISALVCLDEATGKLVQCYDKMPAGSCAPTPKASGGYASLSEFAIQPHQGVHPVTYYTVTYSLQANLAESWSNFGRRALATRSHLSTQCGILRTNKNTKEDGFCYDRRFGGDARVKGRKKGTACPTGTIPGNLCIDNGYHCSSMPPAPIIDFLGKALKKSPTNFEAELDGHLFCYSVVNNPYVNIKPPKFHFTGIDKHATGAGAQIGLEDGDCPVQGSGPALLGEKLDQRIELTDGHPTKPTVIKPTDKDLTINMVFSAPTSGYSSWYLYGPAANSPYSIQASDSSGEGREFTYQFYYNATDAPTAVDAQFTKGPSEHESPTHAQVLTVVQRKKKVYFFYNGCMVKNGGKNKNSAAGNPIVTFGPVLNASGNSVTILQDLRIYDSALSGFDIKRNFKVDANRYGAKQADCTATNLDVINDSY